MTTVGDLVKTFYAEFRCGYRNREKRMSKALSRLDENVYGLGIIEVVRLEDQVTYEYLLDRLTRNPTTVSIRRTVVYHELGRRIRE